MPTTFDPDAYNDRWFKTATTVTKVPNDGGPPQLAGEVAWTAIEWVPVPGHGHGPAPARPARNEKTPGRNSPCHCGSGRKYKKCCRPKE